MYDNVSHQVKLERLEPYSPNENFIPRIEPKFYVSNSMSSNFLFDIQYGSAIRSPEFPYDNYLLSTRNNEMTIFSSGYIDYLRNGYNYDQEANKQAARQQIIGSVINTVGAAASIYTGGASIFAANSVNAAYQSIAQQAYEEATGYGARGTFGGTLNPTTQKKYSVLFQDEIRDPQAEAEQAQMINNYHEALSA